MKTLPLTVLADIAKRNNNGEFLSDLAKIYSINAVTLWRHLIKYGLKQKSIKRPKIIHYCAICSAKFSDWATRKNRRCCSKKCANKYQSIYRRGENAFRFSSISKKCVICNKAFMVTPYFIRTKTTCSKKPKDSILIISRECLDAFIAFSTSEKSDPKIINRSKR